MSIDKLYINIKRIQKYKDNKALNNKYFKKILKFFKNDIYFVAKKYSQYSFLDFEDIKQELSLLLYNIVIKYDTKKRNKFKRFRAYILTAFHNECNECLTEYKRKKKIPFNRIVSLDSALETKDGTNLILRDIIPDHSDLFKQISDRDFVEKLRYRVDKRYRFIIDKMLLGYYEYKDLIKGVRINNKKVQSKYIYTIIKRRIIPEIIKLLVELMY